MDDVAGIIRQSIYLKERGFKSQWMTWRAFSVSP